MNLKEQIDQVQKKVDELRYKLAVEEGVLIRLKSLSPKKERKLARRKAGPPRKGSLAAHIQKLLRDSGGPLSVVEIAKGLEGQGFSTGAKTRLNNLIPSAIPRRPDIFERVRHGVYDLKKRHEKIGDNIN